MAVPELVITAAPYKVWPGGIISFRAIDWLAGARGTLSTETDARSIEGDVVRDTQATASVVRTAQLTAFQNADDTLEIDMTGIPVELNPVQYNAYASVLIEGDWNTASAESYRDSSPVGFKYTARLGLWGDDFSPSLSFLPTQPIHYPRNAPQFRILEFDEFVRFTTGTMTLHLIAFAGPGSTVEWLIDQFILVPFFAPGGDDIMYIPASFATDQVVTPIVDGADGGDDNGKFTWHPQITEDEPHTINDGFSGDGGGDYQQDDSEYMIQLVPDEGYSFGSSASLNAHAYSVHGAYFREAETYELDQFSRTLAGLWGTTPRGYRWTGPSDANATPSVDGSRGKVHFGGLGPADSGTRFLLLTKDDGTAFAKMRGESLTYSGILSWEGGVIADAGTDFVTFGATITTRQRTVGTTGVAEVSSGLSFDVINGRWKFKFIGIDLSGGWINMALPSGIDVGFKIEIRRHRIRVRVWDASGAEPSTWDIDDFRPVNVLALNLAYSYSDDPLNAIQVRENLEMGVFACGKDYIAQWDFFADDIKVEYDPVGTTDDVNALMEAPDGNEVGRITIPSGAWHFVYWGNKTWVGLDGFGDPNLSFSAKVWDEAGAAELQRAEVPFWWFRSAEAFTIVSMNWRIADRTGVATRVLVGE